MLYLSLCRAQQEAERMKVIMAIMRDHGKTDRACGQDPAMGTRDGLHFSFIFFSHPIFVLYFLFPLFLFSVPCSFFSFLCFFCVSFLFLSLFTFSLLV